MAGIEDALVWTMGQKLGNALSTYRPRSATGLTCPEWVQDLLDGNVGQPLRASAARAWLLSEYQRLFSL